MSGFEVFPYECLALIEGRTAELYERLIDKTSDPKVRLILSEILLETRKHEKLLTNIASLRGLSHPPKEDECRSRMGRIFEDVLEALTLISEYVAKGEVLKSMEILLNFEGSIGEEYFSQLESRLALAAEEEQVFKAILRNIAEDEERHVRLLKLALTLMKTG